MVQIHGDFFSETKSPEPHNPYFIFREENETMTNGNIYTRKKTPLEIILKNVRLLT